LIAPTLAGGDVAAGEHDLGLADLLRPRHCLPSGHLP
jgi:hypothetical protein